MSFLSAILRVVSHFRENRGEERKISKRASVRCEQRYREPLVARASEDAFESCVWSLINNKEDKRFSFITFTSSSMLLHLLHCWILRFSILTKEKWFLRVADLWEPLLIFWWETTGPVPCTVYLTAPELIVYVRQSPFLESPGNFSGP